VTTIGISGISPYLCTPVVGPVTISGEIDAGRIQHLKLLIRVNLVHNRRVALGPRDVGGLGAEPDDVCADKDQSRCHEHEEWLQRRVVPQGGHIHPLRIVTSSLVRTISTAATTKASHRSANPTLDEIKAGAFDGLTYEEIERLHPREFELDCYHRISTVLADIKATPSPVLIVAHQAILRCMVGSITDRPPDVVPYIDIPQYEYGEVMGNHFNTSLMQVLFQAQIN